MISQEYIDFFKGLESNNNKAWFHDHKKEYETQVKAPFLLLLENLIPKISQLEPLISENPKDALFRIHRDIRFSKDKTPYNTLMKAGFSPGGKKSFLPGYYLGISAEYIHVGGGLFNIKAPEVKKVRDYIKENQQEFSDILNSQSFKKTFQALQGEKAKRLPKEFQTIEETIPEIANKQFYAMQKIPLKKYVNSKNIENVIMSYFNEISILNSFLNRALSGTNF